MQACKLETHSIADIKAITCNESMVWLLSAVVIYVTDGKVTRFESHS